MTEHYHGTPITPRDDLDSLAGSKFCVSVAAPKNIRVCASIGSGLMLDNGAFSAWTRNRPPDWPRFYRFVEKWQAPSVWAVIPDAIDGEEADNDTLLADWPRELPGAPVWHMHESIGRLCRLAERWPRVCIGSSRSYRTVGSPRWHDRMTEAMNMLCGNGPAPVLLHMLRGMSMAGSHYPFASVDSTDIGRNHKSRPYSAKTMARRWEAKHCAATWIKRPVQLSFAGTP